MIYIFQKIEIYRIIFANLSNITNVKMSSQKKKIENNSQNTKSFSVTTNDLFFYKPKNVKM